MKAYMIVVMALVLFGGNAGQVKTQRPAESHLFFFHFPRTIDTTSLSISYFLLGPFGGHGSFVETKANTWDYAIETSYENKPARTLKAIVFCPGYQVKLLTVPSLEDSSVLFADLELKPLRSIHLSGKVMPTKPSGATGLRIEATYLAFWGHEFFGISDGAVPSFNVASINLSEDGSFSLMVPDFAHYSTANSFKEHGAIELVAREPKSGNIVYFLERANQSGMEMRIPVAEEYNRLNLYARPNL